MFRRHLSISAEPSVWVEACGLSLPRLRHTAEAAIIAQPRLSGPRVGLEWPLFDEDLSGDKH